MNVCKFSVCMCVYVSLTYVHTILLNNSNVLISVNSQQHVFSAKHQFYLQAQFQTLHQLLQVSTVAHLAWMMLYPVSHEILTFNSCFLWCYIVFRNKFLYGFMFVYIYINYVDYYYTWYYIIYIIYIYIYVYVYICQDGGAVGFIDFTKLLVALSTLACEKYSRTLRNTKSAQSLCRTFSRHSNLFYC